MAVNKQDLVAKAVEMGLGTEEELQFKTIKDLKAMVNPQEGPKKAPPAPTEQPKKLIVECAIKGRYEVGAIYNEDGDEDPKEQAMYLKMGIIVER